MPCASDTLVDFIRASEGLLVSRANRNIVRVFLAAVWAGLHEVRFSLETWSVSEVMALSKPLAPLLVFGMSQNLLPAENHAQRINPRERVVRSQVVLGRCLGVG